MKRKRRLIGGAVVVVFNLANKMGQDDEWQGTLPFRRVPYVHCARCWKREFGEEEITIAAGEVENLLV